ncbi:TRAP transporter small permease [Clostridium cochlearium]|uniref:Tripartite AtP-independent periplasmic transporter subunit DctQ n=1 Tax=Clostridium cochlearium TaxID=1494 RepID=A0A2X2Y5B2_CLOCO|nr:TRAP transporter small permease [Clostridium cochlearium]MBE6064479.1 TRAP transporter small permease [Clostridium cochlearium]MBU5269509.1 TRAP transporter small permease [Clostridium cochlearium]SQB33149.1 tripartite AtP-independent periplasmic transporter subunit DctQ [Clostridium cochlearium]
MYESVRKILQLICNFILCALVLIVSYVAFMRYVFKNTPAWGESLALLMMVWFCLLSSALAVSKDVHLKMTLLDNFASKKLIKKLDILSVFLWLIFGLVMIVSGIRLTILANRNIITGLGLPSGIIYAALPVSGLVFILEAIDRGRKELCIQQQ